MDSLVLTERGDQALRQPRRRRPDADRDRPRRRAGRPCASPACSRTCRRTRTCVEHDRALDPASSTPTARFPHSAGAGSQRLASISLCSPGADPATINAQLPAWEKRNIPRRECRRPQIQRRRRAGLAARQRPRRPSRRRRAASPTPGNDRRTIVTFAIVAALILGMACVNFINLATARASQRAREVALRKVLGANRKQLIAQFLGESMLVAGVAMLVALAMVELAPYLSAFLDADLDHPLSRRRRHAAADPRPGPARRRWPAASIRPSICRASSRRRCSRPTRSSPRRRAPGGCATSSSSPSSRSRSASSSAPSIVYAQTVFAAHHRSRLPARGPDPGRQHQPRRGRGPARGDHARDRPGRRRRERRPHQHRTAATGNSHQHQRPSARAVRAAGASAIYSVDPGILPTHGGAAARRPDAVAPVRRRPTDLPRHPEEACSRRCGPMPRAAPTSSSTARRGAARLSRSAGGARPAASARYLPRRDRHAARDDRRRRREQPLPLDPRADRARPCSIDFGSLSTTSSSATIRRTPKRSAQTSSRSGAGSFRTCPSPASSPRTSSPSSTRPMRRADETFAGFAALAVVIACLGLFGLAAFTAERRTKEIGIRKVFGARSRDIVKLLAWQFSKPVIIANLIAWPVAWWVMRDWLNSFDARIDLGPAPFVVAGAARSRDRDRHHRRPCPARGAGQSDPRLALRIGSPDDRCPDGRSARRSPPSRSSASPRFAPGGAGSTSSGSSSPGTRGPRRRPRTMSGCASSSPRSRSGSSSSRRSPAASTSRQDARNRDRRGTGRRDSGCPAVTAGEEVLRILWLGAAGPAAAR